MLAAVATVLQGELSFRQRNRVIFLRLFVMGVVIAASGCSSLTMSTSSDDLVVRGNLHTRNPSQAQFEYGREAPVVDGLGNVVSIPRKLLLWNRRVNNHRVSSHTEEELRRFCAINELGDVKVRVNQYAPLQEWRRLGQNSQIHPVWRYTAGTLRMLGYTLLPGRVFGNDNYNPYTNTVSIYSDVPSLGIAELAYAKDIQQAKQPGMYAISQEFAGLDIIHATRSTQDAINYLAVHGELDDLKEGYQVLYPSMGSDVGSSVASFLPQFDLGFGVVGAVAGHVAGRQKARDVATATTEID